jgi:SAM-dependent methyltransferase
MSDNFYKAFEDKYRGSQEIIKERVKVYLPFVFLLKEIYPNDYVLDIGCGRGEWLQLLKENDIYAKGIDLDDDMLDACLDLNLDVTNAEGIETLKKQDDESLICVSAFHVVEHISFDKLRTFVDEALRVLKPGGLLIMETPNPENIKVATENFYLDPSHISPIPSKLLSFLPEFYGYERTKVLGLQENKLLANQKSINLFNVIEGVSPDYAVIAQKKAGKNLLKKFNAVFSQDIGLSLTTLTNKFDDQLQEIATKVNQTEAQLANQQVHSDNTDRELVETQAQLRKTEEQTLWLQIELDKTHENIATISQKNDQLEAQLANQQVHSDNTDRELVETQAQLRKTEAQSQSLLNELKGVYASKSWRITKPVRLIWQGIRMLIKVLLYIPITLVKITWRGFKWPFKCLLSVLMRFILKSPKLKARAKSALTNYPRLQARLRRFTSFRNIAPSGAFVAPVNDKEHENTHIEATNNPPVKLGADLSPNARKIYNDLKIAIENKNKESN